MHCLQVLSGSSLVFLISLTSKDKRCTMECTMNYFVYAFMGREGGHVPKCAIVNSQGGSIKNYDFEGT